MRTLSPKTLKEIEGRLFDKYEEDDPAVAHLFRALRAAFKPKRSLAPARKRRQAKKTERREKTAAVREAVVSRADGVCECGCRRVFTDWGWPEMDHFHSGSDKRAQESVEGCWLLRRDCHRTKHDGDREGWLRRFLAHSARHGLNAQPQRKARAELDSLNLQSQMKGGTK